jgi:hypothetical protein
MEQSVTHRKPDCRGWGPLRAIVALGLALPILIILAFNGGLLILLIFRPLNGSWITGIDNCAQFAGPLIALPWAIGGGWRWRARPRGARGWAPVFLGLGALCFALGQIIWAWY